MHASAPPQEQGGAESCVLVVDQVHDILTAHGVLGAVREVDGAEGVEVLAAVVHLPHEPLLHLEARCVLLHDVVHAVHDLVLLVRLERGRIGGLAVELVGHLGEREHAVADLAIDLRRPAAETDDRQLGDHLLPNEHPHPRHLCRWRHHVR